MKNRNIPISKLERRAQEIAPENASQSPDKFSNTTQPTLLELCARQIELELQNEALKQTQLDLEAERARYFDLYDLAPVGYLTISEQGLILDANLTSVGLLGLAQAELVKRPIIHFICKPDQDVFHQHCKQLLDTGEPQSCELRIAKTDGEQRLLWAQMAVGAAKNAGAAPLLRLVLSDAPERKRAEQALRESEDRYRTLVEFSPDSIGIHCAGKVVYANATMVRLFHARCPQDLIGMDVAQLVHPDYRAIAMEGARGRYENVQPAALLEEKFITLDGQPIDVEVTTTPIVHAGKAATQIIIRDVSERKLRENEMKAIARLSAVLRTARTRSEMLPVIVEQLNSLLHCDSISAEMIDPLTREAVIETASGGWSAFAGFRQPEGTGLNAVIAETRKPYRNNKIKDDPAFGVPDYFTGDVFAGAGVPLIAQDQLIGFLWVGRNKDIDESEFRLLVAVADIAANALHRATLHERTQKDAADLTLAYDTTLEGWARALELRDQETEGHARRVVKMTVDLARAMGFDKPELENIRRGALLHDIGKMAIPDSVLLKPGTLNEREWEIMRRHPEYAYQLLEPIEYLRPVLDVPSCHHEKWDGSGYQHGWQGEQIPLMARIFAIVDVWDALRSDRPYRPAWETEKARNYIVEQSGKHFDPQVVQAFLELLEYEQR